MSCEKSGSFVRTYLETANQARHSDAFVYAKVTGALRCYVH